MAKANIEKMVDYIVEHEQDNFIEELPKWLGNDVDCSPEVEADAIKNPEKYDTKAEHIFTVASLAAKGK